MTRVNATVWFQAENEEVISFDDLTDDEIKTIYSWYSHLSSNNPPGEVRGYGYKELIDFDEDLIDSNRVPVRA